MSNYESKITLEAEERTLVLKRKVAQATLEQVEAEIQADVALIRASLPSKTNEAAETAQDVKYAKARQASPE